MKHIAMNGTGEADVMVLAEGDAPICTRNEVLIQVQAAGVNRPDVVQRQGLYPPPPGASPILGLEVAGEVIATGPEAKRWKVGDRVCALTNGGGYAEQVAVPETQCLPIPDGLSMVEAASLPETCFTVWSNVFDRGGLQAGERFLVHGGSSGIGVTAIQLAAALGATVYTTAGTEEKCRKCESLGATRAINYRQEDFAEVLKEVVGKAGINVILDMVGGDYIQRNIKVAAVDGRIVNIAYLQGSVAEINFMHVMLKRLTLTGSTLRPQSDEAKSAIARQLEAKVWPLIAAGSVKPVIAATFPLSEVVAAHRLMESNTHIGKIILDVMGG